MLHDFILTENYCIIPDLPLEFSPRITKLGGVDMSIFKLNKSKKSYLRLIDRKNLSDGVIKSFEFPSH